MNISKRVAAFLSVAFTFLGAVETAEAVPLSHVEKDVTGSFSDSVQKIFNLFADSVDSKLIWYVANEGRIVLTGSPTNPIPRFSVSKLTPTTGFYPGQEQLLIGGSFGTSPLPSDLDLLRSEAQLLGYKIAPVLIKAATTSFTYFVATNQNGPPKIECVPILVGVTRPVIGQTQVQIPECSFVDDNSVKKSVNILQKFSSINPTVNSSTSTNIPFQATLTPAYTAGVVEKLKTGANWDDILIAVYDWDLETIASTKTARITVNWNQTFDRASAYFTSCNNACLETEVSTFFADLIGTGNGIVAEYPVNSGWTTIAPNDEELIAVAKAVEKQLRSELVVEYQTYNPSQPGSVNGSSGNKYYTLRANYGKQLLNSNETHTINYYSGSLGTTVRTSAHVSCLIGGLGLPVRWNTSDPACNNNGGSGGQSRSSISMADVTKNVNEADGTITVQINRAGDITAAATVEVALGAGTAVLNQDFTLGSKFSGNVASVTFPENEAVATVELTLIDDSVVEQQEEVLLHLQNPGANALIGSNPSLTINVLDNDSPNQTPSPPTGNVGGGSEWFLGILLGLGFFRRALRRTTILYERSI